MPNSRQPKKLPEPEVLVRVWALRLGTGVKLPFFERHWAQLVYAVEGVIVVTTPEGTWVVPSHRAVWVPAGIAHELTMHGTVSMRCLFFRPGPATPKRCQTLAVTPLVRELIRHVAEHGPLFRNRPADRRLARVVLDQLSELPDFPTHLPQPTSAEAKVAVIALYQPEISVEAAASEAGLSKRTLERRFRSETGLSVGLWRSQALLIESLKYLAAGEPVGDVAFRTGYASPSAFIAAFRRTFGTSPGEFRSPGP